MWYLCPSGARSTRCRTRWFSVLTSYQANVPQLDAVVAQTVVERFDHQDLNLDPGFSTQTTTGENLVLLIWDLLVDKLPAGRLVKVGVIETRDNYFEYSGSAESRQREEGVRHG